MRIYRPGYAVFLLASCLTLLVACDSNSGSDCLDGETDCSGVCADTLVDDLNCGGCGIECAASEVCTAGLCESTCAAGEDVCGVTCVDLQTSPIFCGDCTTSCAHNEECVAGVCEIACGDIVVTANEECQDCAEYYCCPELAACPVGSDCAELMTRIRRCQDDPDCVDFNVEEFPDGAVEAVALNDCLTGACPASDCAAGMCLSEIIYPSLGPISGASMSDCVSGSCCDSYLPCYGDAECVVCIENPGATGCDTNTLYSAFMACRDDNCPTMLCASDLSYPSVTENKCTNDNCCAAFDSCTSDTDCSACLSGGGTDCDNNALFTAFADCKAGSCVAAICTVEVGYANFVGDPMYECNECLGDNCCTPMETCAGDSSPAAMDLCITCLTDPESAECDDPTVRDAAVAFTTCQETSCQICTEL